MGSGRVVITGGAGFIGSRLTKLLLAEGRECLVLDNLSVGLSAPESHPLLRFEPIDICDVKAIEGVLQEFGPDCVVHLAAIHHIPTCEKNAPKALSVNVVGTQSVLDAAERAGARRFVLGSSGAVYDWITGDLEEETSPLRSTDVYSVSKLTNEHQLELATGRKGLIGVVARIFNTIGPGDPNAHLIPDVIRQMHGPADEIVLSLGNTHTFRDYVFVGDTAACLAAMVRTDLPGGQHVFNIGTGIEHSVVELVDTIARVCGRRYRIQVDPERVRKIDRPSQRAATQRAKDILGWQAKFSFEEAIARIVEKRD